MVRKSASVGRHRLGHRHAQGRPAATGTWPCSTRATRELVAGSAYFGADERAQGFVHRASGLVVQACRRSGSARTARIDVTLDRPSRPARTPRSCRWFACCSPTAARKDELTKMGLDLTEHGGKNYVEVVLHGAEDAKRLREAKFAYTTRDRRPGRAEPPRPPGRAARARPARVASALPSGRTGTYRRLDDYNQEMKTLASQNPDLVKPLTLPFKTLTGHEVQGIEITEDVTERDGKPVFLQMGVHHAREWPSAENAIEFAYELVKGYKADNARVRRLMKTTRTIVVPVVNPEGFNTSREAGQALGVGRTGARRNDTGRDRPNLDSRSTRTSTSARTAA